eukprot:m.28120 g.28120  ORF g.28120 m.28120 type:complete len:189 (+) comp14080_c0_seq1:312-878(+)
MERSGGIKQQRKHLKPEEKHRFVIDHSRLPEKRESHKVEFRRLLDKYGMQKSQGYDIIKNYNQQGSEGLHRKRGSGGQTKMTDKVVKLLNRELKTAHGDISVATLTDRINADLFSHEVVSTSTVYRWLHQNGVKTVRITTRPLLKVVNIRQREREEDKKRLGRKPKDSKGKRKNTKARREKKIKGGRE